MKMNIATTIGYIASLLVILAAVILILLGRDGSNDGVEMSPLAYSLLLLGHGRPRPERLPIFIINRFGLGISCLGLITGDDKPAE